MGYQMPFCNLEQCFGLSEQCFCSNGRCHFNYSMFFLLKNIIKLNGYFLIGIFFITIVI